MIWPGGAVSKSPSIATLMANLDRLATNFERHVTVQTPTPCRVLTKADLIAAPSGSPLLAYHSFAVFYFEENTSEIEGDVVEWPSTSQLDCNGIDKKLFRTGDTVRIWASPNKDPHDNHVQFESQGAEV